MLPGITSPPSAAGVRGEGAEIGEAGTDLGLAFVPWSRAPVPNRIEPGAFGRGTTGLLENLRQVPSRIVTVLMFAQNSGLRADSQRRGSRIGGRDTNDPEGHQLEVSLETAPRAVDIQGWRVRNQRGKEPYPGKSITNYILVQFVRDLNFDRALGPLRLRT